MKTTRVLSLAVMMAAMLGMSGITFDQAFANNNGAGVGSGGFQLNLKGIEKGEHLPENADTSGGHKMFVHADKKSRIFLAEGPFAVIDRDATDSDGGKFQLPAPNTDCGNDDPEVPTPVDEDCGDTGDYLVLVRVLGKPLDTNISITTCQEDKNTGDGNNDGTNHECSIDTVSLPNANGKGSDKGAKWSNQSRQLLTVCLDTDPADGVDQCDIREDIFSDSNKDYLWETDNFGNRNVQLRFVDNPAA